MSTLSVIQCAQCDQPVARVDENGWCEQCWLALSSCAQVFQDLEEIVMQTLDSGVLTPAAAPGARDERRQHERSSDCDRVPTRGG